MTCDELLVLLRRGDALTSPEATAHLSTCADCAPLAAVATPLRSDAPPALDVPALRSALHARLALERGPVAWLRSRPTWQRRALFVFLALLYPTATLLAAAIPVPRPDLHDYPPVRYALELGCLALVALAGIWTALRPVHVPAPRAKLSALLALAAIGLAVLLAVLPAAHGAPSIKTARQCMSFGLVCGLPIAALALLLSRVVTWPIIALTAASSGLFADLLLHVTCPSPEPMHLLLGHASVVAVYAGTVLLAGAIRTFAGRH